MKRAFFLMILCLAGVTQPVFSTGHKNRRSDPPTAITSLIINANVAVVLVNDPNQAINMTGDSFFMEQVIFKQKGNRLIITAGKKRDWKTRGVIYIPAGGLEHIEINNAAKIRSTSILQMPTLKISVNGECELDILINGKIELTGNDSYEIDYHSRDLSQPVLKSWKK
jgi:hypothetical protein